MQWRHAEGVEIWGALTASRAGAVVAHLAAHRPLVPVRPGVRAQVAASLATQVRAEPRHRHVVAVALHFGHALVAAVPCTTRRACARRSCACCRSAAFSVSSWIFDLNGEAKTARTKQSRHTLFSDVRRFPQPINTNEVLGTHSEPVAAPPGRADDFAWPRGVGKGVHMIESRGIHSPSVEA